MPLKFTHLRPKTFRQDIQREREIQNENNSLITKIIKLKNKKDVNVTMLSRGD